MVYVVDRPCLVAESIIFQSLYSGTASLLDVCNFITFRFDRQVWKKALRCTLQGMR